MRLKNLLSNGNPAFVRAILRVILSMAVLLLIIACSQGETGEGVADSPETMRSSIAQGYELIKKKDYEKATMVIFDLIAKDPKDVEALAVMALIYTKQDRLADALNFAEQALEIDPYFSLAHAVIGRVNYQTSHFDEALKKARKALIIDPDSAMAYQLVGEVYLRKGKIDDALLVLKEVIKREPDNPEVLNLMGSGYIKAKKYEQALPHLLAALKLDSELAGIHLNLGLVYNQLGQGKNAMKHIGLAEDLYAREENNPWLAKTRDIKRVIAKKFKMRPEDIIH